MTPARTISAALALAALLLLPAAADEGRLEDPLLEALVGAWRGEGVQAHPLSGEEVPYADRLEVSWALGHRWLRFALRAEQGAFPDYQAEGWLTRPPGTRGRYEMAWLDPERRVNVARGELSADGRTLTLRATDPGGSTVTSVYRLVASDRLELTMELEVDRERLPLLRVTYRRQRE